MTTCDVCGQEAVGAITRRLHSAEREEELKDAAWSTSRVTLHLTDIRQHDVIVCAACRRAARKWYLGPFAPFLMSLVACGLWLALQRVVAPGIRPEYLLLPGILVMVLLFRALRLVRRRYGMGERSFGETPLRLFTLDSYVIRRLTDQHRRRIYWTPRSYRYYSRRFR